jgi:serine/threonine protein kinase
VQVGRYEIVRELGRGGMARVHLARQLDLDRLVALKELLELQREDAEMVGRFLRESRLAGALNHESIVTVLDVFQHDGVRYIAMEYVPRGPLRPWVGRIEPAQLGGVLESVLAGLAHAHAAGVVHRDLKPENLMVTAEGRVKIADFGIARALADSQGTMFRTATGVAVGTPAYMAPEQAMAQEIGPWTDLYAVGVIAYELVSGSVPFSADEPLAVLLAHCREEPPPLVDRAPGVPWPIAGWVHRMLAKDPAQRPESARAAAEELDEHLLQVLGPRWRRGSRLERDPDAAPPVTTAATPTTEGWTTVAGDAPPTLAPEPADPPPSTPTPAPAAATADLPPPVTRRLPLEPLRETPATPPRRRRTVLAAGAAAVLVAGAVPVALVLASGGDDRRHDPAATATQEATALAKATATRDASPTATATATATAKATVTSTPSARRERRPSVASPKRPDDLPLELDPDTQEASQVGDWSPSDDPTLAAAQDAFGSDFAATSDPDIPGLCTAKWRAIGLKVSFDSSEDGDPCDPTTATAQTIEIDGRATDRWRTFSGLRPGMPESAIPKLYKGAHKATEEWTLVSKEFKVSGRVLEDPGIVAFVDGGVVSGFELFVDTSH